VSLLCKQNVRRRVLEQAKATRSHSFTRVSGDVFDYLEAVMVRAIETLVRQQPSKGRTISSK
jgi:hypothetical protein